MRILLYVGLIGIGLAELVLSEADETDQLEEHQVQDDYLRYL